MDSLNGKTVVVGGGTGGVGEGIVRVCMNAGATVIVPFRNEAKLKRLQEYVEGLPSGELVPVNARLDDEESMEQFNQTLRARNDTIDLAVACLGGWYYGYSLHRMPTSDWFSVMNNNLTTHFLFMRAVLSVLHEKNHGCYFMINGGASKLVAPDSGIISIVAAAQKMMTKVLSQEAFGTNVRVHGVVAFNPVKTRDRMGDMVDEWLTAEEVGQYVVKLFQKDLKGHDQLMHTIHTVKDLPWIKR